MKSKEKKRPNVLWLMSDQHNASCTGYNGHPDVRTPNLDALAAGGVNFIRGFCNNPICAPSRVSFATGNYVHTHRMFGNDCQEMQAPGETIAMRFRRYGYQTGLFGKSHMLRAWDEQGFERIRYTDLCDALYNDPDSAHYFRYLREWGLADLYEEGSPHQGMEYTTDGSGPARLPYEHSIEHFTGNETLAFLAERDQDRPFFVQMSFQRPHGPITPAREYFDLYQPDRLELPESAVDWFGNHFVGKPAFMRDMLQRQIPYPFCVEDTDRLKRLLASYFALITCIDMEIGRVFDALQESGEWENTIVLYTADHGDFAGEHGLFHKNLGIYESIHRIPFLLRYPGGPAGETISALVESVDYYPTLCDLCGVPAPEHLDGQSLLPILAGGQGKKHVFCEWEWAPAGGKVSAVRSEVFRLVYYGRGRGGELYDHRSDPGEVHNLWDDPEYEKERFTLMGLLMDFTLDYGTVSGRETDKRNDCLNRLSPTRQLHKYRKCWSDLETAYTEERLWPPVGDSLS
jgi:arylsulfatase A-like enzyme